MCPDVPRFKGNSKANLGTPSSLFRPFQALSPAPTPSTRAPTSSAPARHREETRRGLSGVCRGNASYSGDSQTPRWSHVQRTCPNNRAHHPHPLLARERPRSMNGLSVSTRCALVLRCRRRPALVERAAGVPTAAPAPRFADSLRAAPRFETASGATRAFA